MVNLAVEQEVFEHSLQPLEFLALQPWKNVRTQGHLHPLTKRLRLVNTQLAKLRPDGNTRIGREDIWREAHIAKLTRNLTHGSESDGAVCLGLTRIAEDQVKGDPNVCQVRFTRSLEHLVNALVAFVHQLQNIFRC